MCLFCHSVLPLKILRELSPYLKNLPCIYEKKEYLFAGNTEIPISCCKRLQISLEEVASTVADKKDIYTTHVDIYSCSIKYLSLEAYKNFLKL